MTIHEGQAEGDHYRVLRGADSTGQTLWRLGLTEDSPDGAALYVGDEPRPAVRLQPADLRSLATAALGAALEYEVERAGPDQAPHAVAGLRVGAAVIEALLEVGSGPSLVALLEHLAVVRAVLDGYLEEYGSAALAALAGDVATLEEWGDTAEGVAEERDELLAVLGCRAEQLDAWLAAPAAAPPIAPQAWRRLSRLDRAAP